MTLRHRALACRPGWRVALALLAAGLPGTGHAQDPLASVAGCALHWQVEASQEGAMRRLLVTLRFDAQGRRTTHLRLPGAWPAYDEVDSQGAAPAAPTRLQAVVEDPRLRRVQHNPDATVQLQWRLQWPIPGSGDPGLMAGPGWFAFTGAALLPLPDEADERTPPAACISLLSRDAEPPQWISSHGEGQGRSVTWRLPAAGGSLRSQVQQAVYAGGRWQSTRQVVEGQALTVAQPAPPEGQAPHTALPLLAQTGARALAAQRRHWPEALPAPALMLWLLPGPSDAAPGNQATGSAWHQAMVVQASAATALPAQLLDGAIAQALSRLWLQDRFGPLVQAGRDDAPLRRWFSEGVADFLAHQALLRDGRWSPADWAAELNRQIDRWALPGPGGPGAPDLDAAAARGEWLALHWHQQLRAQGQPGLDPLLRRLLIPAAQARREGPISAPLATHRLVAALRARLGDAPLREVQRVVDRAEPVPVHPDTLAACFSTRPAGGNSGLLRVQALDDALQLPACQGWLGLGPQALRAGARAADSAAADPPATPAHSGSAGRSAKAGIKKPGKAQGMVSPRKTGKPSAARPRQR